MRQVLLSALGAISLVATSGLAMAEPAVDVLGKDYVFPNRIEGLPARLSEFEGLQVNTFVTDDGVRLAYWEAGTGQPLIFVPGWSANGAEYVNVMYLLSRHFRVIVLDPRNQGLSQKVDYGTRISRFSMDLKQMVDHLGVRQADFCGWSMGASVLWGYIDLFGTKGIRKLAFVDEPISIVAHGDWSERERQDAGALVPSPEPLIAALDTAPPANPSPDDTNLMARMMLRDSAYFANSEAFAQSFVKTDPNFTKLVMYDHFTNDWRDVVRHKIDRPTAIFTGEWSANVPSQRWARSVIPGATLHVYTKAEQGDHFLMFKNPVKFTDDLRAFLDR
ncbi:alpha/beta hydrolase [Methylobacterium sp. J-059]|jgi:pimeloyl-ACP methyl ester carboxylesterase|uniref:alpha/beta fold hydrolase n=1 Tax=Methylobacterium sp. J-059 TaxID=2836643 RepID=UPI001FBB8871|nr:alpha/beta hydrolase [Methylobacterium sp. J-059]MCJ2038994.1 alpha/beta hydrolase [Methylobacterium sp. J-059]